MEGIREYELYCSSMASLTAKPLQPQAEQVASTWTIHNNGGVVGVSVRWAILFVGHNNNDGNRYSENIQLSD